MAKIIISLSILLMNFCFISEAGITEIPPLDTSNDEAVVETVADDAWMPSNIFDVSPPVRSSIKEHASSIPPPQDESPWSADSIPIFQAIRDFIFQTDDESIMMEESDNDPTEEIVKIIEKGLMEATTAFLTPSDDDRLTVSSIDVEADPISVVKIENDVNSPMLDRINVLESPNKRASAVNLANTTTACSSCYNRLENCVQKCFKDHNCHDVQRQARTCPSIQARMCGLFTQWGPEDECKVHEDCRSPLLCCNDGCVNKCTPGEWRN